MLDFRLAKADRHRRISGHAMADFPPHGNQALADRAFALLESDLSHASVAGDRFPLPPYEHNNRVHGPERDEISSSKSVAITLARRLEGNPLLELQP